MVAQGVVHMDLDQQDYLGVLLGGPRRFGSEAGRSALAPAPAGKATLRHLVKGFTLLPLFDTLGQTDLVMGI